MSAAAPWSVKGIDPKAREVAKDLARRSGMTLGEWLNTMIMDDAEDEEAPASASPAGPSARRAESAERRPRARRMDDLYDRDTERPAYADRPAYSERGYTPIFTPSEDVLHRVAASVDAIAARLEAAERRSTVAIQGVDQAVSGLVRRLDGQDTHNKAQTQRIDEIAEELREGHRRLRSFEREVGPETKSNFEKVETGVGALASRLYDIEERQRAGVNELRARMEAVEKVSGPGIGTDMLAQVGARLDSAQARTTEALKDLERSFAGLDQRLRAAEGRVEPEGAREAARFEKLAETLARQVDANRTDMMRRLDTVEQEGRMGRLEGAVQAIGETLKAAEQRSVQGIEAMGREVLRIAQNLNGRVQKVEADATSQSGRLDGLLNDKIAGLSDDLTAKLDRDMGRYAQAVDQRLNRTDDAHALALEKLGGEITRISDRLADRIAQSERKSAQALEEIGQRLSGSSERIEQRYDRASGELAERMRLSEERTVRLLAEARDAMAERAEKAPRDKPRRDINELDQPDWRTAAFGDEFDAGAGATWSADPFGGETPAPFPSSMGASLAERVLVQSAVMPEAASPEPVFEPVLEAEPEAELADDLVDEAVETPTFTAPSFAAQPFTAPTFGSAEAASRTVPQAEPDVAPQAFGGFGGADVEDALEATDPMRPQALAGDYDAGSDEFEGETDFVDARALRANLAAGAANGRSAATRSAIDAARAAMTAPAADEEPRSAFGLKKGGKSRLQERLDKQASKRNATVRNALLASVTGMAVVGGAYSTWRLTGGEPFAVPGLDAVSQALGLGPAASAPVDEPTLLAAVALTPTEAVSADQSEAQGVFDQAIQQLDTGQPGAVATLTRAANLGLAAAQLKLAGLYETGDNGVKPNPAEARLWARRAAEGGDAQGMHAFGMYLFDGVGGAKNRPEALNWLLKAADKGLVDSQFNVAKIYENGDEGIAANPTEALKWYMIAARTGDTEAPTEVRRLSPQVQADGRRSARAAADAFQIQPLA